MGSVYLDELDAPKGSIYLDELDAPPQKASYSPEAFSDTTLGSDVLAGIGGGAQGMFTGTAQLGVDLAQMIPGMGDSETLANWEQGLNATEEDRRAVMDALKAKYGDKGIENPMSWSELGGEIAPTATLGGGRMIAKGLSGLPGMAQRYGGALLEGAKWGAVGGATMPTLEDESRLQNTAVGAGVGAVAGPALTGVADLTKMGTKYGIEGVQSMAEKLALRINDPDTYEKLYKLDPIKQQITKDLRLVAPMTPSAAKTPKARAAITENDVNGIKVIGELRDHIELEGEVGRLPQSQEELLDASRQGMTTIMEWISKATQTATDSGVAVDLNPVIKHLRGAANNKGLSHQQRNLAQRMADEFEADGKLNPADAVRRMSGLNNDIKMIYQGKNTSGDSPEILAIAANNLRAQLNKTLEQLPETGQFSKWRKDWGALKDLEERIYRSAEKRANKDAKGGMSMFDIISAEQAIHGIMMANPKYLGASIGSWGIGKTMKYVNSPDTATKRIMSMVDDLTKNNRYATPNIPEPVPPTSFFDETVGAKVPFRNTPVAPGGGIKTGGQPHVPPTQFEPTIGASMPTGPAGAISPRPPLTGGQPFTPPPTGEYGGLGRLARPPQIGEIRDNHQFLGGNPADKASWKQVQ